MPVLYFSMTLDGPVVDALVGISRPRHQMIQAAGGMLPPAVPMRMLIDSGASGCCINQGLLSPLGITPSGSISMHTPTTGGAPVQCNQYDVGIMIVHPLTPFFIPVIPIIECRPLSGNIQGPIGRDALAQCMFIYYGQIQGFSLAF